MTDWKPSGLQPTLYTSRLILRPHLLSDLSQIEKLVNASRDIADNTLRISYPYNVEDGRAWIERQPTNWAEGKGANFAILHRDHEELIGSAGLGIISRTHSVGEIGYWLAGHQRNQGYSTEVVRELVRLGFEALALNRIQAEHYTHNPASGRVMEKAGMTYEGTLRQRFRKPYGYVDAKIYAILRED